MKVKKLSVLLGFLGFSALTLITPAHATKDLVVVVKYFSCDTNGKFLVRYDVINPRNYDRVNTHITFKILRGDKVAGCEEVILRIPANSDGSEVYTTIIDGECGKEKAVLKTWIFQSASRYRVDEWLSGCP